MEKLPDCELGNTLDKHEGNRKFLSKFGLDAFKVRPCEWYQEEYKECRKLQTKFRDLYVSGTRSDCLSWYRDYKNCMKFRRHKDIQPFEQVLISEKKRIEARTNASQQNDVWNYRTDPSKDFNVSLEHVSRSIGYSPFEVYENIKASRKKRAHSNLQQFEDTFII